VAAALAIQPGLGALTAARMDGTVQSWPMTVWAGSVSNAVASTGIPRSPDSGEAPVGRPAEDGPVMKLAETEPNDLPEQAQVVRLPAEIQGRVSKPGDADLFRFEAAAGESWVLEVNAARSKSDLDSKI
jgi:hypothetical protein